MIEKIEGQLALFQWKIAIKTAAINYCLSVQVAEMETILQEHNNAMPARDVLQALADKFRYAIVPSFFWCILRCMDSI